MALPIESRGEFDPSVYYARKPVLRLIPGLGLGKMMEAADKYGPKFWGIDKGLSIAPIADDYRNRILQFNKVLASDPEIDSETYIWSRDATKVEKRGKTVLGQKIKLQRKKSGARRSQPEVSVSYAQALEDPEVMFETYKTMHENGDSVAKTIAALEDWRLSEEGRSPTTKYLKIGIATYELAMLSMRETQAKKLIGQAAISRHVVITD